MRPLVSKAIAQLPRYRPGRSIEEIRRELGLAEVIKLASNESAFGPSPKAVEAMRRALVEAHRYPDEGLGLREELAQGASVKPEQLVLGAGATELIAACVRAFATSDGHALISDGSFVAYKLFLLAASVPFTETPLAGRELDLDALARSARADTQLLFLPNPNNPTGSCFGQEAFERFLARLPAHVVLVLDDAYRDYHEGAFDTVAVIRRRPRTVVLRSFSKVHGLAGLRVGYALSSSEVIEALRQVPRPFPTSQVAFEGARAALHDLEHLQRTVEGTRAGRALLYDELRALGLRALPSHTNFVTVDLGGEAEATGFTGALLRRGFIVRPLAPFGMPSCARISVGTLPELKQLVRAVAAVLEHEPRLKGQVI